MKVGDLERMKYMMYSAAKGMQRIKYTQTPVIVMERPDQKRGTYQRVSEIIAGRTHRDMAVDCVLVKDRRACED